jgi:hypothetical protein
VVYCGFSKKTTHTHTQTGIALHSSTAGAGGRVGENLRDNVFFLPYGAHNQSRKTHHKVYVCCTLLGRHNFITAAGPHMFGRWVVGLAQGARADGLGPKHNRLRAFWITKKQPVHGQLQAGSAYYRPTYHTTRTTAVYSKTLPPG